MRGVRIRCLCPVRVCDHNPNVETGPYKERLRGMPSSERVVVIKFRRERTEEGCQPGREKEGSNEAQNNVGKEPRTELSRLDCVAGKLARKAQKGGGKRDGGGRPGGPKKKKSKKQRKPKGRQKTKKY